MLLVAFKRELGENGESCCWYVVDDSVWKNKIDRKGFSDLAKLLSKELESLINEWSNYYEI